MPSEEKILDAIQRLNGALQTVATGQLAKQSSADAMNNDDEELAAYQASISAQNDQSQGQEQKGGAFERMKGDDPNWRVKTSEGQATLADIKKRRRDELEEAQEEGVSRKFKIVMGEKTIISHYCSICGEHCVAADTRILKLPRRRTAQCRPLGFAHNVYRILLKRPNGVEQQYRFYCRLGIRLRGGRVAFLNALHLALRRSRGHCKR
eukprot:Skav214463  [mRNA]  locus=scaffold1167:17520:25908:+ [translate_table: standard]